jgi:hypothetical protein
MGTPVRVQCMIPQNGFLGKAKPLEQLQCPDLLWWHASDDFRDSNVQNHLERQLQQEPTDSNSSRGLR